MSALAEEAAAQELSFVEFTERVLAAQVEAANLRATDTLTRLASFPAKKTLAEFDFSFQRSVKREEVMHLAQLDFLREKKNIIFLGPPGTGKTHPRHRPLAWRPSAAACR